MAYRLCFYKRARRELDECCQTYGDNLRTELWNWLRDIATAADTGSEIGSVDIIDLLDEGLSQDASQWSQALKRWWNATPVEKIKATLVLLRKRCPPWQARFTVRWITVLGQFPCEIHAHYIVDHVNKQVILTLFDGLPGQT
ncbi:MAG: hypothetical protein O3C40_21300 [Planctomycetota bacterium]|nr:hypothetical protein [Planctomycetota bacterium]